MDIPEGNISAKKLTAENVNIELGGGDDELPQASVPLAVPKRLTKSNSLQGSNQ